MTARSTPSEAKPARWDWEESQAVVVATISGAPKNWVALSGGEIRAIRVREADSPVTKNMANTRLVQK